MPFKFLILIALFFTGGFSASSQCIQIQSILVDACGAQEGLNEMVRFQVGANPINTSNMDVDWPNNNWTGLAQNATTAAKVAQLNQDILDAGGCGQLIQPTGGVIPAGATVILVTSHNMDPALNQFGPISEDIYILFQNNPSNATGHFANYNSSGGIRTLEISFGGCSDTVSYERSFLVNPTGGNSAADGATVEFSPSGAATYINNGCQAPVNPFTVDAGTTPVTACAGTTISLNGTEEGAVSYLWTAPSGTFANPTALSTTYTLDAAATGSVTLTLTVANSCGTEIFDTVVVNTSASVTPTFSIGTTYCSGASVPSLPTTSTNGINGSWSPSAINNTADGSYVFTPSAGQCATTFTLNVTVGTAIAPVFTLQGNYCNGATTQTLPTVSDNGINGTWSPSVISNTTSGTYTFTPNAGQCADTYMLSVTIGPPVNPTFTLQNTYCAGETTQILPSASNEGIPGSWSPSVISNTTGGSYVFTPSAGQCATSFTLSVTITSPTTPAFSIQNTYCSGDTVAVLPTVSDNGITGTWSPSAISNTTGGSYVFTPAAGECATTFTLNVTIGTLTTTAFTLQNSYCTGATTQTLPTTSDNGVTGTWSPSVISNTTPGTYVFTPTAGQCATTFTLNVSITTPVAPTFTIQDAYCQGESVDVLPTVSDNGISGTWSPSAISNTANGSYVFTPSAGECATSFTLSVTITSPATPAFTIQDIYCSGDMVDILPTVSDNGINGTWSPSAINNTANGSYVFTPSAGQCATSYTLNVTIGTLTTTAFTLQNNYCAGETTQTLPTMSDNGVIGTWSPSVISNTTSGSYVFTPSGSQCATTFTLTVSITTPTVPAFTLQNNYCNGSVTQILPATSDNGVSGSWSPSVISNTASGTYVFTPSAGQCATNFTLNVTITNPTVPTFTLANNYCSGTTTPVLPTTSNNAVTGTWSPSAINNTTGGSYVFTPTAGQCAVPFTLNVTINSQITPSFNLKTSYCSGETTQTLPSTSINGVAGTWSPSVISNTASGSYVFTPTTNPCATTYTLNVTITNVSAMPEFSIPTSYCLGAIVPSLPTTSDNGVAGTWSPMFISNVNSMTYTFTPTTCGVPYTMNVTINHQFVPAFTLRTVYCEGETTEILPSVSNEGVTGSWLPATVSNTAGGFYKFIPNPGQCAAEYIHQVTISRIVAPVFTLNTVYCEDDVTDALPTVSDNGISGTWSPSAISNASGGTYTFTPGVDQCSAPYTLTVTVNPRPDVALAGGNICLDDAGNVVNPWTLDTGLPTTGNTFTWTKDGVLLPDTTPSIDAIQTGIYEVTVTNDFGCVSSATATVGSMRGITASAIVPSEFTGNRTVYIEVSGGSGNYLYSIDGETPQHFGTFSGLEPGEHTVEVWDAMGCGRETITFFFLDYPKYFTPNGDGIHDWWNVSGLDDQPARVHIFDRYGKLLKTLKASSNHGWDGTYNGRPMPSTDYWFTLDYFDRSGNAKQFRSHFSLKR